MRIEYLFAATVALADAAARKQGWRPTGRTAWLKVDGTIVCFICLAEQLAVVPDGATVHVVGKPPADLRRTCLLRDRTSGHTVRILRIGWV
jgi:hypothetical protein